MTTRLGLDLGGSFLKAVVLDESRRVVHHRAEPVPATGVVSHLIELARTWEGVISVGVGLAGLVADGELVWGPHVPERHLPVRRLMEEALGVPVVVDNDANLAALAETTMGAAVGCRHVLFLSFGTGIGAGIVEDGRLVRGGGFAGEVGHMTLDPGGRLCACGLRGCWETLVSGGRLDQLAAELGGDDAWTAADLVAAAEAGDPPAVAVLIEAGEWLGRGVATLVAILDPELVVLGGAAASAGEVLLAPARRAIASHLSGSVHRRPVRMVTARFGPLAGAVGAALLAETTQGPRT
jgi:glucokinase